MQAVILVWLLVQDDVVALRCTVQVDDVCALRCTVQVEPKGVPEPCVMTLALGSELTWADRDAGRSTSRPSLV